VQLEPTNPRPIRSFATPVGDCSWAHVPLRTNGESFICRRPGKPDQFGVLVLNQTLGANPQAVNEFLASLRSRLQADGIHLEQFQSAPAETSMVGYKFSAVVPGTTKLYWTGFVYPAERVYIFQCFSQVPGDSPAFTNLVKSFPQGERTSLDMPLFQFLTVSVGPIHVDTNKGVTIDLPPAIQEPLNKVGTVVKGAEDGARNLLQNALNTGGDVIAVRQKIIGDLTSLGMKALPPLIRDGVDHLSAEAKKEILKNPIVGTIIISGLHLSNPTLAAEIEGILRKKCDAPGTIGQLASAAHPEVTDIGRHLGDATTVLKRGGVSGWVNTGCTAEAFGVAVHDAQVSTDELWTIDVQLKSFAIGSASMPAGSNKFIRIEVEPGGRAHDFAQSHLIRSGIPLRFGGVVLIDTDFPQPFLEVHPLDDLEIVVNPTSAPIEYQAVPRPAVGGWLFLGKLGPDGRWARGSPRNVRRPVTTAIKSGELLKISNPSPLRSDSKPLHHADAALLGIAPTGENVRVVEKQFSHARTGGNFVWVKVERVSQ
jgi:hypothetical protein